MACNTQTRLTRNLRILDGDIHTIYGIMANRYRIIIFIYLDRFITGTSSHRSISRRNLCLVQ